jgi:hypothetical protein
MAVEPVMEAEGAPQEVEQAVENVEEAVEEHAAPTDK